MLHRWEEPCISVGAGSGAVFFSGCSLHCVYCQNGKISRGGVGELTGVSRLAEIFLELQAKGAANINLVTPTHFTVQIAEALRSVRDKLTIPVVWNTSGYEKAKTLELLDGLVDVFLTDFKYASPELAAKYSGAPDYPEVALSAVGKMVSLVGEPVFDGRTLRRGVIVRHLVLPGCRRDSMEILRLTAENVGVKKVLISLMSQYTPEFLPCGYPEINRRVTTFEYDSVCAEARRLGFDGFTQSRESASAAYTPDF